MDLLYCRRLDKDLKVQGEAARARTEEEKSPNTMRVVEMYQRLGVLFCAHLVIQATKAALSSQSSGCFLLDWGRQWKRKGKYGGGAVWGGL